MDPAVLATSNGHSGAGRAVLGSTSYNLKNDSLLLAGGGLGRRGLMPGLGVIVSVALSVAGFCVAVVSW